VVIVIGPRLLMPLMPLRLGSGAMPEYRAFLVGRDGHFSGCEEIVCDDDAQAVKNAERLVDGHDVELWNGPRLVIVLQHTSDEVRALNRQIDESVRMSKNASDAAGSARMDKLTSDLRLERDAQQKRDDEK
jgi:hypothetical protein